MDGAKVRVRCPACGEGFEGRMGHGRDDAFFAEAAEAEAKKKQAAKSPPPGAPGVATSVVEAAPKPAPRPRTAAGRLLAAGDPEPNAPPPQKKPWNWSLPAEKAGDLDALMLWTDIVESVHNGRQSGHRCPYCSEPLTEIENAPPYVRIRCAVCGEGFEGRIG